MFIPLYIKGLQQTSTLFKTDSSIKSFEELLNVNMQEQFEVNFDEEF